MNDVEINIKLLQTESDYEGVKWAPLVDCRDQSEFLWTRVASMTGNFMTS